MESGAPNGARFARQTPLGDISADSVGDMSIVFPAPLQPGDTIGITAPSSGVGEPFRPRMEFAMEGLRERGFEVRLGDCFYGGDVTSAPAADRAAELMDMMTDPQVRAVVPPWGGALGIDLLTLLDFEALAADPTWLVGYSDTSTLMFPLTVGAGVATLHGSNLAETPFDPPAPLRHWLDMVSAKPGETITQAAAPAYKGHGWDDFRAHPSISEFALHTPNEWKRLDGQGDVDVTGRLIGGCLETVANLAGTRLGDVAAFAQTHAPEGLIIHLEASESDSDEVARRLWGLRLAGWFDRANGIVIGRTRASGSEELSQHDAVRHALGDLGIPIVADVEVGHVAPFMPLVGGSLATLRHGSRGSSITQTFA